MGGLQTHQPSTDQVITQKNLSSDKDEKKTFELKKVIKTIQITHLPKSLLIPSNATNNTQNSDTERETKLEKNQSEQHLRTQADEIDAVITTFNS